MSVRAKLLVIITFVALVPISILAYTILRVHQDALEARLSELQLGSAKYGAKIAEANLERPLAELVPLVRNSIDWSELTGEERDGALLLVHQQLGSILAVALIDDAGVVLGKQTNAPSSAAPHAAAGSALDESGLTRLIAAAKPALAARGYGEPLALGPAGFVMPFALHVGGAHAGHPLTLVIGVDLAPLCSELNRARPSDSEVILFDAAGRSLCPRESGAAPVAPALLARGLDGDVRYTDARDRPMLAAVWATPNEFRVAVTQPLARAFAPSERIRGESSLWIALGVLAAIGAGLLLSRAINRPLEQLSRGAERVAAGDFAVRLDIDGNDELAAVTRGFNHMCGEIERRDREIRTWNEELQARIATKAAELERAHNALLESRKIGAMSALAAGVAHEINNPLTGVIGLTQVLLSRARKDQKPAGEIELLNSIEREAQRVRKIVEKMAELSEGGENRRLSVVSLADTLHSVLHARRAELARAGIELQERIESDLPPVMGQPEQLVRVFDELIDNAARSMRGQSGSLSVSASAAGDGLARLQVKDTGKGIAAEHIGKVFEPFFTTKEDWNGKGLGLTAAYRVIEAHHGVIRLESQLNQGTTVTIELPTRRHGAHLQ